VRANLYEIDASGQVVNTVFTQLVIGD